MIVEGEGAYTTVQGEKCPMHRGDLILTPTGLWHEHGHEGSEAVVWLDVLDLPLVHYLEASYAVEGERQRGTPHHGEHAYTRAGLAPAPMFERSTQRYPLLRYPWADARAALEALARAQPQLPSLQVTYLNPETGGDAQNILGFHALMLRPGETMQLPARSPASVFHLIEGRAEIAIGTQVFTLDEADTCCAPGYTPITLRNGEAAKPCFIFIADESPLHRKLGLYEFG